MQQQPKHRFNPSNRLLAQILIIILVTLYSLGQCVVDSVKWLITPPTPTATQTATYHYYPTKTPTRRPTKTLTPYKEVALRGCVRTEVLNVREDPSLSSPVVYALKQGECRTFDYRSHDKLWVKFYGGWMYADYLDFDYAIDMLPGWVD